jgi:hypothetical protein
MKNHSEEAEHDRRHHHHSQVGELFEDAVKSIHFLRDVPDVEEFVLATGERLKSLLDLQSKLRTMAEDIFVQHVNEVKNDFATWVYHTIGDKHLAEELGPLKSRHQNLKAVKERVRHLVTEKINTKSHS